MTQPAERIVNLALYLGGVPGSVTAEQIRANVEGYSPDQEDAAFLRMLERDKDELRASGFVIEVDENRYRLDRAGTFASTIDLTAEESAAIRVVGTALLDDASFPYRAELRLALAKIATAFQPQEPRATARMADEHPAEQGALVACLDAAITARKRTVFDYVNSAGEAKRHEVEPYGLFARDGRWYLVARDSERDELRVYAVSRMDGVLVEPARPKSPDFDRPDDFDVATFIALPFQYGSNRFLATIRFSGETSWRAAALTCGKGATEPQADGSVLWSVEARDEDRLMRWIIENGPGVTLVEPASVLGKMRSAIEEVARG